MGGKWYSLLVVVGSLVAGIIGGSVAGWLCVSQLVPMKDTGAVREVVKARRFIAIGDDNETRALLDSGGLSFEGAGGKVAGVFTGSTITLGGSMGNEYVNMGAGGLMFWDDRRHLRAGLATGIPAGVMKHAVMLLCDETGNARVVLQGPKGGLQLLDENKVVRASLVVKGLSFRDEKGKVVFKAPVE